MMRMTRSEIVCLLLGVLCIMQISAAPVTEVREGNNSIYDDIIAKLTQLRKNEGEPVQSSFTISSNGNSFGRPEDIMRVHRTLDNLGGGYLLKRAGTLDSLGGGYLLKRAGTLDSLGGGYLL